MLILDSDLKTYNRGTEAGNIYTLRDIKSPSVSIELGILNNPDDVRKLSERNYFTTAATSILEGLSEYINSGIKG